MPPRQPRQGCRPKTNHIATVVAENNNNSTTTTTTSTTIITTAQKTTRPPPRRTTTRQRQNTSHTMADGQTKDGTGDDEDEEDDDEIHDRNNHDNSSSSNSHHNVRSPLSPEDESGDCLVSLECGGLIEQFLQQQDDINFQHQLSLNHLELLSLQPGSGLFIDPPNVTNALQQSHPGRILPPPSRTRPQKPHQSVPFKQTHQSTPSNGNNLNLSLSSLQSIQENKSYSRLTQHVTAPTAPTGLTGLSGLSLCTLSVPTVQSAHLAPKAPTPNKLPGSNSLSRNFSSSTSLTLCPMSPPVASPNSTTIIHSTQKIMTTPNPINLGLSPNNGINLLASNVVSTDGQPQLHLPNLPSQFSKLSPEQQQRLSSTLNIQGGHNNNINGTIAALSSSSNSSSSSSSSATIAAALPAGTMLSVHELDTLGNQSARKRTFFELLSHTIPQHQSPPLQSLTALSQSQSAVPSQPLLFPHSALMIPSTQQSTHGNPGSELNSLILRQQAQAIINTLTFLPGTPPTAPNVTPGMFAAHLSTNGPIPINPLTDLTTTPATSTPLHFIHAIAKKQDVSPPSSSSMTSNSANASPTNITALSLTAQISDEARY